MTSDAEIVERLRELGVARAVEIDDRLRRSSTTNTEPYHVTNTTEWQAAESITRLSARVEELRSLLAAVSDEQAIAAELAKRAGYEPDALITLYAAGDIPPPLDKAWRWHLEEARSLLSPSTNLKE